MYVRLKGLGNVRAASQLICESASCKTVSLRAESLRVTPFERKNCLWKMQYAYQSLACETDINTDLSDFFSLKRIYVKYKNAILSLIACFFRTWKD